MSNQAIQSIWVVDDDIMSREVASLLLADAGFDALDYASGEDALTALEDTPAAELPIAMLVDMQMPGLTGDALAARLRAASSPATQLIAMSGTAVPEARRTHFDDFLMKPFSSEDIHQLFAASKAPQPAAPHAHVDPTMLNEATFNALCQTMPQAQLRDLYVMCLDDVEARLKTMEHASEARDDEKFRLAAHSIKGGCGMVGAVELAHIAADFEHHGMPVVHNVVPFQRFLAASARLRGMLGRVLDHAD